jgi:hypothetical protein
MNKLEKIERQEQKTREKITALQAILRQIDGARTEQENLQIVQQIRALKMSREDLYAFINGGILPASLAGAFVGADAPEPETIHSRQGRKRRNEPDNATEPEAGTPEGGDMTTNFESEVMNHEDN